MTEVADSSSSCNVRSLTRADGCSVSADETVMVQTWKICCFCVSNCVVAIDSLNENIMKRSCHILN